MRTYSRKRPEYKELENVMDLCRLCLEKPDECIPIYSDDSTVYSSLAFRIMVCVGLEISKEECLSNIICAQCHNEVEMYYSFRKKCAKSYEILKMHIQAVKAKEYRAHQNVSFYINPDGSILLRDGNGSVMESEEPLVTLTKILNEESKVSNSEVLQMFDKTAPIPADCKTTDIDNSVGTSELLDKTQVEPDQPTSFLAPSPSGSKEHLVIELKDPLEPEISEFLSTMLTQLGILTQHADGVIDFGPKTSRTLELETRDGNNITFELVEEDEEENSKLEEPILSSKEVEASLPAARDTGQRAGRNRCGMCGKVLASRSALARHVRNVHARVRPHACATCGARFAQKEVLARHVLVHQEKRPFQCDKCPKSFTQRSALETHTRLHLPPQERSLTLHQCPQCTKLFLHASGLSRHIQQHSNTQFPCGECGRAFADKSSLRRHERTLRHSAKKTVSISKEDLNRGKETKTTDADTTSENAIIESKPAETSSPRADTGG